MWLCSRSLLNPWWIDSRCSTTTIRSILCTKFFIIDRNTSLNIYRCSTTNDPMISQLSDEEMIVYFFFFTWSDFGIMNLVDSLTGGGGVRPVNAVMKSKVRVMVSSCFGYKIPAFFRFSLVLTDNTEYPSNSIRWLRSNWQPICNPFAVRSYFFNSILSWWNRIVCPNLSNLNLIARVVTVDYNRLNGLNPFTVCSTHIFYKSSIPWKSSICDNYSVKW
jgi:hypothetical protein